MRHFPAVLKQYRIHVFSHFTFHLCQRAHTGSCLTPSHMDVQRRSWHLSHWLSLLGHVAKYGSQYKTSLEIGGGGIMRGSLETALFFSFTVLFNYVLTPVQWQQMMDGFIKGLVWNKVSLARLTSSSFHSSGGEKMGLLYSKRTSALSCPRLQSYVPSDNLWT